MTAINLSNAHGSEGKLGQAYIAQNKRFAEHGRGLRLYPFDFHSVCGGTRYDRFVCSASLEITRVQQHPSSSSQGTALGPRVPPMPCLTTALLVQCK